MSQTSQSGAARRAGPGANARLAAEFALIYLIVPVAHVVWYGALGTFTPLAVLAVAAVALLAFTPDFRWLELVDVRGLGRWLPAILGFAVLAAAVIFGFVLALVPGRLLSLPRYQPELWGWIMLLYPPLSVATQEVLYRALFFRRYGHLFGSDAWAVVANAAAFALAHAFYQNWVAVTLTFAGGLVFGTAYVRSGSFPLVVVLHTIAGQLIFTSGLGLYFYHGAIPSG